MRIKDKTSNKGQVEIGRLTVGDVFLYGGNRYKLEGLRRFSDGRRELILRNLEGHNHPFIYTCFEDWMVLPEKKRGGRKRIDLTKEPLCQTL